MKWLEKLIVSPSPDPRGQLLMVSASCSQSVSFLSLVSLLCLFVCYATLFQSLYSSLVQSMTFHLSWTQWGHQRNVLFTWNHTVRHPTGFPFLLNLLVIFPMELVSLFQKVPCMDIVWGTILIAHVIVIILRELQNINRNIYGWKY